jgi:hypothetical protein
LMPMDGISLRKGAADRASAGSDGLVPVRVDLPGRQIDHGLRVRRRQPRPWPWLADGQWTKSPERVDQQSKPRPANAVLLPVLDPRDHGLIDTGIRLEHALRPAQRHAASFDFGADQLEPVLFLRIALPFEPSHGASLAATTYPPGIRRSSRAHLAGDMPSIGINNSGARGRLKSSIKFGTLAARFGGRLRRSASGRLGAWAPEPTTAKERLPW